MPRPILPVLCLALALAMPKPTRAADASPSAAELDRKDAAFAPVDLKVNLAALPEGERAALAKLVLAARIMDSLFLRQAWSGNESMLLSLASDPSPLGKARLRSFLRNKGPWDRLDHDRPFIPGAPPKPPEATFYPAGATKAEVEAFQKGLPESERTLATGFFTTLRRSPNAQWTIVPYSTEYQPDLARASALLIEAAALTREPSLKKFLEARAAAFLSNDYYPSDVAWMELDAAVEPTIGPYEVYEDGWFNAKAAFEAFICVRDDAETNKLQKLSASLQDVEDHLPIEDAMKSKKLGALAPIRVVNEVFAAGDAMHGVQTAAYNLPNDERVVKEKGSKRVMLKNVQEAKFEKVLRPIVKVALSAADQKKVSFEAFFTHILMHELMHGLGPHEIQVGGRATTVRAELGDLYSSLEEAKADISGLFAMHHLIDTGALDRSLEKTLYVTFLASAFRSIRFGLNEAHGRGIALQMNWILDHGGFTVAKDGTFAVDEKKIREAVTSLTKEIMTLQARGDRAGAEALVGKLAVVRPEVKKILERLKGVPVDIAPRFVSAP